VRVPVERLRDVVVGVFTSLDVPAEDADVAAWRLLEADLRGRTGHGLIRVPQYVPRLENGGINPRPDITVLRPTPVSGLVDGDNGLGQVVMTQAARLAIDKAQASGMAWVGTVRSNHAGAAGVYTAMALQSDLIAIYMAVGSVNVMPPWGGREPLLGPNPISIAIPAGEQPAFQLDIATTVASHGTIKVLAQSGEQMPEGWAQDREGHPITDPLRADEGFLLPIGGHKGAGLSMAIGLLAGLLNDAAFGSEVIDHRAVSDVPANTGQAMLVLRPDLFRDLDAFKSAIDEQLGEMRSAGPPGSVHIPGEDLSRMEQEQRREGIDVPEKLLAQLAEVGTRLGVVVPWSG